MAPNHADQLRQLPLFAALPSHALTVADSLLTPSAFTDGTVLCSEHAVARQAFILTSGAAVVSRGGSHVATVGAGDIVGEMALLDGLPRTATVTAVGPVEALVMTPQEFSSLLLLPGVEDAIRNVAADRRR
jgi:CRP/FNR family cyclic AMP-dependent transcriptional regulator